MWEIFSLGQTPYAAMSNTEVLERVVMGYRLPAPTNMPEPASAMMLRCWSVNRPSFESMSKALHFWSQGGDVLYKPALDGDHTAVDMRKNSNGTPVTSFASSPSNPMSVISAGVFTPPSGPFRSYAQQFGDV
jgi:hypothetical protein